MNHLEQLQKDAGLDHCPTELTYQLRLAVEGEPDADDFGSYAYEWTDKPHRLVFAACQEIERQAARIKELEANNEKLGKLSLSVQFGFLKDMETDRSKRINELQEERRELKSASTIEWQEKRIERLEECLRMCVPYLSDATATKDEVMEMLGGAV